MKIKYSKSVDLADAKTKSEKKYLRPNFYRSIQKTFVRP